MEEQYTKEMFRLAETLCVKYNALCKRGKDPHGNDICPIYTTNNNFAGSLKISMWREEVRFCYFQCIILDLLIWLLLFLARL